MDILDIINEIHTTEQESSFNVLESLILYYDKHDVCNDSPEIFQESSSSNGDGFFKQIGRSIVNFFKMIGDAIKRFFNKIFGKNKNKNGDSLDKLDKIDKMDDKDADKAQSTVDSCDNQSSNNRTSTSSENKSNEVEPSKTISKKVDEVNKKTDEHQQLGDKVIDNDLVSEDSNSKNNKKNKRDKKTKVNVKSKTVSTRILWWNWVKFVDQCNEYFEQTTKECSKINAVYDRPTRYLKNKTYKELDVSKKDMNFDVKTLIKYRRKNGKKYNLFSNKSYSVKINDIIKDAKVLKEKLIKLQDTCEKCVEQYNSLNDYLDANSNNMSNDAKTYLKQTYSEYLALNGITLKLIGYFESEMILYGQYADLFLAAKEYNDKHKPVVEEPAKEKTDDKKDDKKTSNTNDNKDADENKSDNKTETKTDETSQQVSEYVTDWYNRL